MPTQHYYYAWDDLSCDNCEFIIRPGDGYRYVGLGGGEVATRHYPTCPVNQPPPDADKPDEPR